MKLAEGLAGRAAGGGGGKHMRGGSAASARYQEGEEPAEDAAALLVEAEEALVELESMIRRVNRTNAATDLGDDGTMTDALARRDVLRLRHAVLTDAADAAAGRGGGGYRQLRSELRQLSALPVAELRARADGVARDVRELDVRVQRANWEVDLLD
ncbi:MAG: DIP1984 family protein [Pseudonocardia sp.]|nr:DIP1984 family protein [Pseudonocardia sp.]